MKVRAVLAVAAVIAATGCTPAPEPPTQACDVEDSLQAKVELALNKGYEATGKYGLAEAAGEDGWLVALEYTSADGAKPQAGVWFTRDTGSGQVFSVDESAMRASSWGLGEEDAPSRRKADRNYPFVLECLAERGETAPVSDT